ncbi:protein FAM174C [Anabrus simplex]|uniref:protein FAM174C n=1 Tax=Anabrus simplex TaxID=316456 RepID=UPI0035A2B02C
MLNNLVTVTNTVAVTLVCVILQCSFFCEWRVNAASDVESARPSHEDKAANAPLPQKNNTAQAPQPSNVGENLNHTVPSVYLNDTIGHMPHDAKLSPGAVLRGFYVFVGLGAIVVMYIVVRTIRLRRKKTTVRKYGILASREDVEMTPLGAEDEDEDTTLFDVNSHPRP